MEEIKSQESIDEIINNINKTRKKEESSKTEKKEKFPPHTDQWGWEKMFIHSYGEPKHEVYAVEYRNNTTCCQCGRDVDTGKMYDSGKSCPFCGQRYDIVFWFS